MKVKALHIRIDGEKHRLVVGEKGLLGSSVVTDMYFKDLRSETVIIEYENGITQTFPKKSYIGVEV